MDTGAAGAKAGVASLGGGANAINIVTSEDLGGGLKGGFNSQMRFNAATGDRNSAGTGSALFHAANAYIGGGFGTVAIGKIAEASNCAFDPWGCTGGAGVIAGAAGVSGLIAAGTQAQSISYTSPTIAGFSGSYQTSVSSRKNERSVLNLGYANGPLAAQFLQSKGTANVVADLSVKSFFELSGSLEGLEGEALEAAEAAVDKAFMAAIGTDAKEKGTSIGASYDLGIAKLAVFNAKTEAAGDGKVTKDITGLTATIPMGAVTLLAGYAKDKKAAATADTKIGFGMNYALSKRTTLGADLFKQDAVGGSTGFVTRVRHTF
jgi:predicted porin